MLTINKPPTFIQKNTAPYYTKDFAALEIIE